MPLFEISGNLGIDVQDWNFFLEFEEERKKNDKDGETCRTKGIFGILYEDYDSNDNLFHSE